MYRAIYAAGTPALFHGHMVASIGFVFIGIIVLPAHLDRTHKNPGRTSRTNPALRIALYTWITALIWTGIIGASLAWDIVREKKKNFTVAQNEARNVFEKDLIYYQWASEHNGVYVPVSPVTPANPYLANVKDNMAITPSGRQLTLVNPEYMIRQAHGMRASNHGALGHITSLDPIRPRNAADPWETKALQAFEQGEKEVASIQIINGRPYLRMMRPLVTGPGCLQCHAAQGYRIGDIHGGISVAIPMGLLNGIYRHEIRMFSLAHGIIWALGILGLFAGSHRIKESIKQQEMAETRTRAIIDNMLDGLLALDKDGKIESLNIAASRIFRYDPSELVGQDINILIRPPEPQASSSTLIEQLRKDMEDAGGSPVEVRGIRKNGSVFPLEISFSQTRTGAPPVLIAMVRDISKKKTRKAEALGAGQLAAIGELASGIAHEINNPIHGVINYAQNLLVDTESGGNQAHADILKQIIKESERISVIVRNLLSFTRQKENFEEKIRIKDIIADSLALLRYQMQKTGIHLLVDAPEDLPLVRCNPQQIQLVFVNLLSNAHYALNQKYPGQSPDKYIKIRCSVVSEHGKEYLRTTVTDFGIGIAPEDLGQIFDPLFTTKPLGKGTGLGLSISQGIIKDHHGHLKVESIPDEQTTAIVDLPLLEKC